MNELEAQKAAIIKAKADKELERGFKLTKEHILFFLDQFKNMDYSDRDCQRRLVNVFINSIFLYDDELKITFNFGGNNSTITLKELNKAECTQEFVCCVPSSTLAITYEPRIMWFAHVFVVSIKIPEK
jgi:hypothetical protein